MCKWIIAVSLPSSYQSFPLLLALVVPSWKSADDVNWLEVTLEIQWGEGSFRHRCLSGNDVVNSYYNAQNVINHHEPQKRTLDKRGIFGRQVFYSLSLTSFHRWEGRVIFCTQRGGTGTGTFSNMEFLENFLIFTSTGFIHVSTFNSSHLCWYGKRK